MDRLDSEIELVEEDAKFGYGSKPQLEADPESALSSATTTADKETTAPTVQSTRSAPGITPHGTRGIDLKRIEMQRLQHKSTVGSVKATVAKEFWLPMGAGRDWPDALPDSEDYCVQFEGPDDPLHAHNWPFRRKLVCSSILAYCTFVASFASAIFSPAVPQVDAHFHVSEEVGTLGITLYVLGFASGPTLWAPSSELKGRKLPLLTGMFGFSVFSIGAAAAKDIQTVMLCRFWAGFFAASPLAIVPACFADLYDAEQRGIAIAVFAMAVFVGPFASPFTGGFIVTSYLHWRWTMYIAAIMGFLGFGLMILFSAETYAPAILVTKAAKLRSQTRNWGIHAKQDEVELDVHELMVNNFSRPVRMLVTEPIVLLVTLYMSFIYGLIYALLGAYPIVFQEVHGMRPGPGGLTFIGLIIGEFLGGVYILYDQPKYVKKLRANQGQGVPEWRLPQALVGGVVFTLGLFWFGWTGWSPSIHWMAPTASGVFVGFGVLCIFLQCFNYLIDSYIEFAASVFAANTTLRSIIGSVFPLFTRQMFHYLGIQWAGTLLACLALLMIPIPVGFMIWGPALRRRSSFKSPVGDQ